MQLPLRGRFFVRSHVSEVETAETNEAAAADFVAVSDPGEVRDSGTSLGDLQCIVGFSLCRSANPQVQTVETHGVVDAYFMAETDPYMPLEESAIPVCKSGAQVFGL
jgi:hypothetical protein